MLSQSLGDSHDQFYFSNWTEIMTESKSTALAQLFRSITIKADQWKLLKQQITIQLITWTIIFRECRVTSDHSRYEQNLIELENNIKIVQAFH